MGNLKKRIEQLKKKRSGYGELLDFYQKVKEAQENVKASMKMDPPSLKKEWKELLAKEGFSLLEKKDFHLDMEASFTLFQALCKIGKDANPHFLEQVKKIDGIFNNKKEDLKELLKEGINEKKIEQIANEFGLDQKIFLFLIQNSIKPSIEEGVRQLSKEIDTETWLKGSCPLCGSLPYLSLFREEVGKRYLVCSFCGYQWRIDRLFCPFCNNKDHESLHYFYGEGEEFCRIDLCKKCHQYIKTIDQRILEELDPTLEDIATHHLDILANQKGYKRPILNPWTT